MERRFTMKKFLFLLVILLFPSIVIGQHEIDVFKNNVSDNFIAAQDYYVIGRYFCVDVDDGDSRGSCDVETRSYSCEEAYSEQERYIKSLGDPCRRCGGQIDNTKKWNKEEPDWIHLGPCR
jgi:hypothetical protein